MIRTRAHSFSLLCGLFAAVFMAAYMVLPAAAGTRFPALNGQKAARVLTIYASLDEHVAAPLIKAFQTQNPTISVHYEELQTQEVYARTLQETDKHGATADLIISSAMDLQMKLANDGYAQPVNVPGRANWPSWAKWRNTAFALTFEPAVIVYHKPSFAKQAPPRTRAGLARLLRAEENRFYGKVATYDIERAGVGYLFLAMDEEHHRDIWSLVRRFGSSGVKLYSNSSAILQRVSDGQFALGYNILGSYASNWARSNPDLGIILPQDYTLVMSRIALVPTSARNADLGSRYLAFLMSRQGQTIMAQKSRVPALHPALQGDKTASYLSAQLGNRLRPIAVRPSLVVYLDQVKRARFIKKWNSALKDQ